MGRRGGDTMYRTAARPYTVELNQHLILLTRIVGGSCARVLGSSIQEVHDLINVLVNPLVGGHSV